MSTEAMTIKGFVLCQDCLKVLPYTNERHNEDELCSCGGQFCGCEDCHNKAIVILYK